MVTNNDLSRYVSVNDLANAKVFGKNTIKHISVEIENGNDIVNYYKMFYYDQKIMVRDHKIIGLGCDCFDFYRNGSCVHLANILQCYYDDIINSNLNSIRREISNNIMSSLLSLNKRNVIKKQVNVLVDIKVDAYQTYLNLKVGVDKFYIIRTKARSFFDVYFNKRGEVAFGKNLLYDNTYYFSDKDARIINFAYDIYMSGYSNNDFEMNDYKVKELIEMVDNFTVNGREVILSNNFDYNMVLTKQDNDYIFNIDIDINKIMPITHDFEYILLNNRVIKLSSDYAMLIKGMYDNDTNTIIFDNNNVSVFSNSILPIVKNEVEVTDSVDDIVIVKSPETKIYFDLNYSNIVGRIEFKYKDNVVDYFDKDNNVVLREHIYEDGVRDDLLKYGFIINKNKFVLNDDELIGSFLEDGLDKLNDSYEVYTSEKMKSLNVFKNSRVKSTFSIGTDNIMKFNFEIDDVDSKDIKNILSSLKSKKKYYKLSSGNYINLDNDALLEFVNLKNDLNINDKDLSDGSVIVPKYRAIYLDSLKNNKYKSINTDNKFSEFIDNFYKYKDINVKFSREESSILRDYQSIGVKWLYNLYKCDLGGVLADEMGLGKSIQTLYFIRRVLKENKKNKILIVTPTSLCYNWEKEIEKFSPEFKYHVFGENRNIRRDLIKKCDINVYITSYGLLREDIELYKEMNFSVFIIDEAQNIKNPNTGITSAVKEVNAKFRLALTGTPIENSLLELWSIFDFVMPGFFGSMKEFNDRYKINSTLDDVDTLKRLNKQISPFILRRKKKDVILDLPDKMENNIYIELSDNEKKIYSELVNKTKKEMDEIIAEDGFLKSRFKILELLTRLRQVCIHPGIIFDEYKDTSSKISEVVKVIDELRCNGHKTLLFSSFRTALSLVEDELKKNCISYYLIDGSVSSKKRMELVDKFNSDDTTVFLIMLKAGGTGLNLTAADTVIHLDLWWNPQAENQATDRAHRIGQKNKVSVIKLIAKGTIEERILELQEKKKMLSDNVIEGKDRSENMLSSLTEKDIKRLLSNE